MKKATTFLLASVLALSTSCQRTDTGSDQHKDTQDKNSSQDTRYAEQDPSTSANGYNNQEDSDWAVTNRVKDVLMNDPRLTTSGRYVNVETNNRVVTLTGNVPTKEDSKYIERRVQSVKGVNRVNNELTVSPN